MSEEIYSEVTLLLNMINSRLVMLTHIPELDSAMAYPVKLRVKFVS